MPRARSRFRPISAGTEGSLALVVACLTLLGSRSVLSSWKPPLWSEVSALPRESLLVLGPFVAGVGACVGCSRHTVAVGCAPGRGWSKVAAAQLFLLTRGVLGGSLVGLLPAIVATTTRATGGAPAILAFVSGWLGLVAVLVLGFAAGVAWSSRIVIVVAAVATYPLIAAPALLTDAFSGSLVAGTQGKSFLNIALVWIDFGAGVGQREASAAGLQRVVLFGALVVAGWFAIVRIGDLGRRGRVLGASVPFVVPIALGSIMFIKQPVLIERTDTHDCEAVATAHVCVPSEVRVLLPAISAGADGIVQRFGLGAMTTDVAADADLSRHVSYWYGGRSLEETEDAAAISTAMGVSGYLACVTLVPSRNGEGVSPPGIEFASSLTFVLLERVGMNSDRINRAVFADPPTLKRLEALNDDDIRTFVGDHADELQACSANSGLVHG